MGTETDNRPVTLMIKSELKLTPPRHSQTSVEQDGLHKQRSVSITRHEHFVL